MVYYIITAVTLVIFLLLHVLIFPCLFLTAHSLPANDRAVMDIPEEEGGRSIIYAPEAEYGKYIKHYIISQRGGKKQFRCEVDKSLRYIEYDIRMFNSKGKMFKVYTMKEVLDGSGIAPATVDLDDRTAYVNVVVRTVDGEKLPYNRARELSGKGVFCYFLCTTITEIVCAFIVKICVAQVYGGIYAESFLFSWDSTLITAAACAVMLVLNIVITCVSLRKYIRGKAVKKRGKHA